MEYLTDMFFENGYDQKTEKTINNIKKKRRSINNNNNNTDKKQFITKNQKRNTNVWI